MSDPEIPACRCPAGECPCERLATQGDLLCDVCRESPRCKQARHPIWDVLRKARDEGRLIGVDKATGKLRPFPPEDDHV